MQMDVCDVGVIGNEDKNSAVTSMSDSRDPSTSFLEKILRRSYRILNSLKLSYPENNDIISLNMQLAQKQANHRFLRDYFHSHLFH